MEAFTTHRKLYVGNLSTDLSPADLRRFLCPEKSRQRHLAVYVACDKKGTSLGYAIITAPAVLAHKLLEKNGGCLTGRAVRVCQVNAVRPPRPTRWKMDKNGVNRYVSEPGVNPCLPKPPHSPLYRGVDTGAYLTHPGFSPDVEEVIQRAVFTGVERMVVKSTCLADSREALAMAHMFPGYILFSVGVHPRESQRFNEEMMSELESLCELPGCVAIGECGLDFSRSKNGWQHQVQVFEQQVALACKHRKPLLIFESCAHARLIEVLERFGGDLPQVAIHSYVSQQEEIQDYIRRGFFLVVSGHCWVHPYQGPLRTWLIEHHDDESLQHLLLASNSPGDHVEFISRFNRIRKFMQLVHKEECAHLTPSTIELVEKHCSTDRNEPCSLAALVELASACCGLDASGFSRMCLQNAERFFRLDTLPKPSCPNETLYFSDDAICDYVAPPIEAPPPEGLRDEGKMEGADDKRSESMEGTVGERRVKRSPLRRRRGREEGEGRGPAARRRSQTPHSPSLTAEIDALIQSELEGTETAREPAQLAAPASRKRRAEDSQPSDVSSSVSIEICKDLGSASSIPSENAIESLARQAAEVLAAEKDLSMETITSIAAARSLKPPTVVISPPAEGGEAGSAPEFQLEFDLNGMPTNSGSQAGQEFGEVGREMAEEINNQTTSLDDKDGTARPDQPSASEKMEPSFVNRFSQANDTTHGETESPEELAPDRLEPSSMCQSSAFSEGNFDLSLTPDGLGRKSPLPPRGTFVSSSGSSNVSHHERTESDTHDSHGYGTAMISCELDYKSYGRQIPEGDLQANQAIDADTVDSDARNKGSQDQPSVDTTEPEKTVHEGQSKSELGSGSSDATQKHVVIADNEPSIITDVGTVAERISKLNHAANYDKDKSPDRCSQVRAYGMSDIRFRSYPSSPRSHRKTELKTSIEEDKAEPGVLETPETSPVKKTSTFLESSPLTKTAHAPGLESMDQKRDIISRGNRVDTETASVDSGIISQASSSSKTLAPEASHISKLIAKVEGATDNTVVTSAETVEDKTPSADPIRRRAASLPPMSDLLVTSAALALDRIHRHPQSGSNLSSKRGSIRDLKETCDVSHWDVRRKANYFSRWMETEAEARRRTREYARKVDPDSWLTGRSSPPSASSLGASAVTSLKDRSRSPVVERRIETYLTSMRREEEMKSKISPGLLEMRQSQSIKDSINKSCRYRTFLRRFETGEVLSNSAKSRVSDVGRPATGAEGEAQTRVAAEVRTPHIDKPSEVAATELSKGSPREGQRTSPMQTPPKCPPIPVGKDLATGGRKEKATEDLRIQNDSLSSKKQVRPGLKTSNRIAESFEKVAHWRRDAVDDKSRPWSDPIVIVRRSQQETEETDSEREETQASDYSDGIDSQKRGQWCPRNHQVDASLEEQIRLLQEECRSILAKSPGRGASSGAITREELSPLLRQLVEVIERQHAESGSHDNEPSTGCSTPNPQTSAMVRMLPSQPTSPPSSSRHYRQDGAEIILPKKRLSENLLNKIQCFEPRETSPPLPLPSDGSRHRSVPLAPFPANLKAVSKFRKVFVPLFLLMTTASMPFALAYLMETAWPWLLAFIG